MEETKKAAETEQEQDKAQDEVDYKALYEQEKAEREKLKAGFDKASSDTAEYKRKLAERLTAEEKEKMEREQADKELREELETLRKEKRISMYTAQLVGIGIDSETAGNLSGELPDGISDAFFAGLKKYVTDLRGNIKAELLNEQPKLTAGMPLSSSDAEKAKEDVIRKAFGLK